MGENRAEGSAGTCAERTKESGPEAAARVARLEPRERRAFREEVVTEATQAKDS